MGPGPLLPSLTESVSCVALHPTSSILDVITFHQFCDVYFMAHWNIYEIGIPLTTDGMSFVNWQRFPLFIQT